MVVRSRRSSKPFSESVNERGCGTIPKIYRRKNKGGDVKRTKGLTNVSVLRYTGFVFRVKLPVFTLPSP